MPGFPGTFRAASSLQLKVGRLQVQQEGLQVNPCNKPSFLLPRLASPTTTGSGRLAIGYGGGPGPMKP